MAGKNSSAPFSKSNRRQHRRVSNENTINPIADDAPTDHQESEHEEADNEQVENSLQENEAEKIIPFKKRKNSHVIFNSSDPPSTSEPDEFKKWDVVAAGPITRSQARAAVYGVGSVYLTRSQTRASLNNQSKNPQHKCVQCGCDQNTTTSPTWCTDPNGRTLCSKCSLKYKKGQESQSQGSSSSPKAEGARKGKGVMTSSSKNLSKIKASTTNRNADNCRYDSDYDYEPSEEIDRDKCTNCGTDLSFTNMTLCRKCTKKYKKDQKNQSQGGSSRKADGARKAKEVVTTGSKNGRKTNGSTANISPDNSGDDSDYKPSENACDKCKKCGTDLRNTPTSRPGADGPKYKKDQENQSKGGSISRKANNARKVIEAVTTSISEDYSKDDSDSDYKPL